MAFGAFHAQRAFVRVFIFLMARNALELSLARPAQLRKSRRIVARAALGGQMLFNQLLAANLVLENVIHADLLLDPAVNCVAGNARRAVFLRMFYAVASLAGGAHAFQFRGTQLAAGRLGLVTFDALDGNMFSVQVELRIFVVLELKLFAGPTVRHGMTLGATVLFKLACVRILVAVGADGELHVAELR